MTETYLGMPSQAEWQAVQKELAELRSVRDDRRLAADQALAANVLAGFRWRGVGEWIYGPKAPDGVYAEALYVLVAAPAPSTSRSHVVGSEQAIAIIEARLPLYTDIGQINALKECISSIRGASPQHVVGSEASEIERLTAERDELQKAIDSAEIEAGITSNGNLWRFWSWRSKELAVKFTKVTAERDRFRAALDKISSPTQTTDLLWWQVEARAALSAEVEG